MAFEQLVYPGHDGGCHGWISLLGLTDTCDNPVANTRNCSLHKHSRGFIAPHYASRSILTRDEREEKKRYGNGLSYRLLKNAIQQGRKEWGD